MKLEAHRRLKMTKIMPCPTCEKRLKVYLSSHMEHVTVRGKDIDFLSKSYCCLKCGKEFDTSQTMDANLERAREAYNRK